MSVRAGSGDCPPGAIRTSDSSLRTTRKALDGQSVLAGLAAQAERPNAQQGLAGQPRG